LTEVNERRTAGSNDLLPRAGESYRTTDVGLALRTLSRSWLYKAQQPSVGLHILGYCLSPFFSFTAGCRRAGYNSVPGTATQLSPAANNESSEVCGIIKPGRRVRLNKSQAVNVHKPLTISYLAPGFGSGPSQQ